MVHDFGSLNTTEETSTYGGSAVSSGSSELPAWLSVPPETAAGRRSDGCWNPGSRP